MKETPDYYAGTRRKGLHYYEGHLALLECEEEALLADLPPQGRAVIFQGELCWARPSPEPESTEVVIHGPRDVSRFNKGTARAVPVNLMEYEQLPKDDSMLALLHQIGGRTLEHTADPLAMAQILDLVEAAIMVRQRERELAGE